MLHYDVIGIQYADKTLVKFQSKLEKIFTELRPFWSIAQSRRLNPASCVGCNCYCTFVAA